MVFQSSSLRKPQRANELIAYDSLSLFPSPSFTFFLSLFLIPCIILHRNHWVCWNAKCLKCGYIKNWPSSELGWQSIEKIFERILTLLITFPIIWHFYYISPPYSWFFCYLCSAAVWKHKMENSRSNQFLSFKLDIVPPGTWIIALSNVFFPYCCPPVSHSLAFSVIRLTVEVLQCWCASHPYLS